MERNQTIIVAVIVGLAIVMVAVGTMSTASQLDIDTQQSATFLAASLPNHKTIVSSPITPDVFNTWFSECSTIGFKEGYLAEYLVYNATTSSLEPYTSSQPFLVTLTISEFSTESLAQKFSACRLDNLGKEQSAGTITSSTPEIIETIGDESRAETFTLLPKTQEAEFSGAMILTRTQNIVYTVSVIPYLPGGALQDATMLAKQIGQQIGA
ncbi:hypothetical protein ACFLQ2_03925 [archaeon]